MRNGRPLAPGLKSVEDATEIRRRVLLAFELAERQMVEHGWHPPLNFVVIGGGPTGVELAGAISDIAQQYMTHDFRHIDPRKSRVLLLDGGPRVLAAYPEDLSAKAEKELARLEVEVHTDCHVTSVGPGWVDTGGPNGIGRVDAAVTLWAAGVQASPLGKLLGVPLDKRGCVPWSIPSSIRPGWTDVFVIGDLAHFEQDGHEVPGVAQPAMQMGDYVRADDRGRPGRPAAACLPLFRQGRHGDHRPECRHCQGGVAVQGAPERLSGLGHVGGGAHLLPDRVSATGWR